MIFPLTQGEGRGEGNAEILGQCGGDIGFDGVRDIGVVHDVRDCIPRWKFIR